MLHSEGGLEEGEGIWEPAGEVLCGSLLTLALTYAFLFVLKKVNAQAQKC